MFQNEGVIGPLFFLCLNRQTYSLLRYWYLLFRNWAHVFIWPLFISDTLNDEEICKVHTYVIVTSTLVNCHVGMVILYK